MTDEWGPWIDHDGKGCPCVGMYVHTAKRNGTETYIIAGANCVKAGLDPNGLGSAWVWGRDDGFNSGSEIIRYRIRKPKGLTILEGILENLPEKEPAQ